jgi:hypothetical protein
VVVLLHQVPEKGDGWPSFLNSTGTRKRKGEACPKCQNRGMVGRHSSLGTRKGEGWSSFFTGDQKGGKGGCTC